MKFSNEQGTKVPWPCVCLHRVCLTSWQTDTHTQKLLWNFHALWRSVLWIEMKLYYKTKTALTCHHVLSSSDNIVITLFTSKVKHGWPFGGAGTPWYADNALTLPGKVEQKIWRDDGQIISHLNRCEHFLTREATQLDIWLIVLGT